MLKQKLILLTLPKMTPPQTLYELRIIDADVWNTNQLDSLRMLLIARRVCVFVRAKRDGRESGSSM